MSGAIHRAVVLGNGASGRAAAALLRRRGDWEVVVLDGEAPWPESGRFELCVTSPGIALDHAWQCAARAQGVRVVSELQLGVEALRARGCRLLAVTGSKGKSSVVKLVAEALGGVPCGNYGRPVCEVALDEAKVDWAVVEVSSFQLETTELPADAFVAAALLNLQEDHLDRHGSAEVYHALKRSLLRMTPIPIDGTDGDANRMQMAAPLLAGSYFDNSVLRVNGSCAAALMSAAGLPPARIAAAFSSFQPLPHRMQVVCERDGVTWIDDSKATSLAALAAGVSMAELFLKNDKNGVFLVAGGLPKGDNAFFVIPCLISTTKKVYLIGSSANQLFDAWHSAVACEVCGTLDRAVENARREASSGDVVLLSPGAASFDQFKSYSARGDAFAALARAGA